MGKSFLLIGSPQSGKSTFLAVNYYLLRTINNSVFLEPDDDETARILYRWEDGLNAGHFPKRNKISENHQLNMSLWLSRKKKFVINNVDVSGELYDKFDFKTERELEETEDKLLDSLILNSLVYILIINADASKHDEVCRNQDRIYDNILNKIRTTRKYDYKSFPPVLVVFTQVDRLNISNDFRPIEFAKQYFPKVYHHYEFFFAKKGATKMFFGCSIGDVEGVGSESIIKKFDPQGFGEAMNLIIRIINKEQNGLR